MPYPLIELLRCIVGLPSFEKNEALRAEEALALLRCSASGITSLGKPPVVCAAQEQRPWEQLSPHESFMGGAVMMNDQLQTMHNI